MVYRIEYKVGEPDDGVPGGSDPPFGGNELPWQLTGASEKFSISRINTQRQFSVIGSNLDVAPNNHGPQTDRLV